MANGLAIKRCGTKQPNEPKQRRKWGYFGCPASSPQLGAIRRSTYSGRPLGSQEFTRMLEKETKRRLAPQKRGPKKKIDKSEDQETFSCGA
jgi:hypothetical protein